MSRVANRIDGGGPTLDGRPKLAARLRALRKARGLTQAQLAGEDFTKGFVSLLETGRTNLSLRAAQVLAARLGVPVTDLLDHVGAPVDKHAQLSLVEAERELADGSPERALKLARSLRPSTPLGGRARRVEGRALLALDRAEAAAAVFERALEQFRSERDRESYIRTLFDLATAQARLDRPEQALVLALECERSLVMGELVDRTFEFQLEAFLAATYGRTGNFPAMEPHLSRARKISEDVADHGALGAMYARLAAVEQERGSLESALKLWRQSLHEFEYLGREHLVADTWHNLATAYLRANELGKAREALDRAEQIGRESKHERLQAWLRVTRAKLALRAKRVDEAARLAEEALQSSGASALARGEALLVRARVLEARRAPTEQLRSAFESVLKEWKDEPAGIRVRALRELAMMLARRAKHREAYEAAQAAIDLLRPS